MTGPAADPPCVLIGLHGYANFSPGEREFWEEVVDALRSHGFETIVAGFGAPPTDFAAPAVALPYGLDVIPASFTRHGEGAPDLPIDVESVVAREEAWAGPPRDAEHLAARRGAARYYASVYEAALTRYRPSIALIWNPHQSQHLILERLARGYGCPVRYVERGPLPGLLQLDAEGTTAGSAPARRADWTWDPDDDPARWRTVYREVARRYGSSGESWWGQPDAAGGEGLRRRLGIPDGSTVVLFAGQVDADSSNFAYSPHFPGNLSAFRWFCAAIGDREDLFILGKHHPKSPAPAARFRDAVGRRGVWAEDVAISDALAVADRVAAVNSTVLFEALLMGTPVLSLGETVLKGKRIAYDVVDPGEAGPVIDEWLDARDFDGRLERWQDFASYLLATGLHALSPALVEAGANGPREFADRLVAATSEGMPRYGPPRFELGVLVPGASIERYRAMEESLGWRLGDWLVRGDFPGVRYVRKLARRIGDVWS